MSTISKTKEERGKIYGDYLSTTDLRASIMSMIRGMYYESHGRRMPGRHEMMIWDVVNKLVRVSVTPDHIDSWHDISVYANLVENALKEINDARQQYYAHDPVSGQHKV